MTITAIDLVNALEKKHSEDIFIPQCKTGSSGTGVQIFDGWAMKKKWANPLVVGYEIKVNRSDFLQDEKWRGYLKYCNQFYFVTPPGLVDPSEIPEPAGLLVSSKNASILYTKKKAQHIDQDIPEEIFRYILMWRVKKFGKGSEYNIKSKKEFWEQWLKEKKINQQFGWKVSRKLSKTIDKKILEVEAENEHLKRMIDKYQDIRDLIKGLGIRDLNFFYSDSVKRKIENAKNLLPEGFMGDIEKIQNSIINFKENIKRIEQNVIS